MSKEHLTKAANLLSQARELNERNPSDPTTRQTVERLLTEAEALKAADESERRLGDLDGWLREPQHRFDHSDGYGHAGGYKGGDVDPGGIGSGYRRQVKDFTRFLREGKSGSAFELKADLVENATGQNLVPIDYAGTIIKAIARRGVIRNLAYVRPTTKNVVDIGNVVINTAGWGKLETGTTATDGLAATPAGKDTITVWDLNALVKLGVDELEDNDDNLADVVRQALALKFAELEDDAYAGGSGTSQPWGITHGVTQGVAAAANAVITADDVRKLPFQVPAWARRNGVYLAHTSAAQAISLLKDSQNRYIVEPSTRPGEPSTLFGYPYYIVDGLPSMTATATVPALPSTGDPSVVFGDVNAGYMIADRQSFRVQVLRERYAELGEVGLMCTMRVGGDVVRPLALAKLLV